MSEQLLTAFLDELAERVAAKIRDGLPAQEEPWRLWTLGETAERLTRSERWVRERVKRGQLPSVRLDGAALAFLPADVQAFAEARRVGLDAALAGRGEWWE